MLTNDHFYHRSIRKTVVSFGTLFNDLEIIRFSKDDTPKERFKVPISYGGKEKYINRVTSDPTLTKSIGTVVPRISFLLTGMTYDASRKQISTLRNFTTNTAGTGINSQYVPVPFNFSFDLSVYVRNTEDGTQILEQILPFFTTSFEIRISTIPIIIICHNIPLFCYTPKHPTIFLMGIDSRG